MKRLLILALALWAFCLPALALNPGEQLADPILESRARAIGAELRCLVCQNQSIDGSDAQLAHDLRVLVRERLSAGDTDRQVLDYVVARYGEFVLLRPVFAAHTALLWIAAPVLFFTGLGGIIFALRRARSSSSFPPSLTPHEAAVLDELERDG